MLGRDETRESDPICTAQFIKAKAGDIDEKTIRHATVGLKDSGSSLNAVWNNLLVPMSAKKRRQVHGVTEGKYVNRLAFELQACGEYDRIMQGGSGLQMGNQSRS